MNPYLLLLPVLLLCVSGAGLSYTDQLRHSRSYIPWMVLLGAACAGLFAWAAVLLDNKGEIYKFSLVYDCLMAFAYYVLPIAILGANVSSGVLVGAAFILVGLFIVKGS